MGRTPRKYVITPGMHIPARPASAPPSFQAAGKPKTPTPKVSHHKVERRHKKRIAPLAAPTAVSPLPLEEATIVHIAERHLSTAPELPGNIQQTAKEAKPAEAIAPVESAETAETLVQASETTETIVTNLTETPVTTDTAPELDAELPQIDEQKITVAVHASTKPQPLQTPAAAEAPFVSPLQRQPATSFQASEPLEPQAEASTATPARLPGAPFGPTEQHPQLLIEAHSHPDRSNRRLRLPKAAIATLAIAILGGGGAFAFAQVQNDGAGLPSSIVAKVTGFTPYYLGKSFKTNFTFVKDSAAYKGDTLTFELSRPDGKKVTITEVKTPANYDLASLQADEVFDTSYGRAFVVDNDGKRTTGALFSKDSTWILANAPTHISNDDMHDLIANFGPVKQK